MSRWLKLTVVLAAAAFVVAFRFSADGNDADATTKPVTAARASAALEDKPAAPAAVRLARVVELPGLASEPAGRVAAREKEAKARAAAAKKAAAARKQRAAAKRKKQAAAKRRAAAARRRAAAARPPVVTTPAPTVVRPAPTAVYRPPAAPAPRKQGGSYVGKGFDSEG